MRVLAAVAGDEWPTRVVDIVRDDRGLAVGP